MDDQAIIDQEGAARTAGRDEVNIHKCDNPRKLEGCGYYPQPPAGWVKNLPADDRLLKFESENWRADIEATLVFLRQADSVLLIRKKTGHGKGKINAPGGKVEPGESPEDCARREMFEEVGLTPENLTKMASLRFIDTEKPDWLGHIFVTDSVCGNLQETREATPLWCRDDEIPYAQMWRDDQLWLPEVMRNRIVSGTFLFYSDTLVAHRFVSRHPATNTGVIEHYEDRYFSHERPPG